MPGLYTLAASRVCATAGGVRVCYAGTPVSQTATVAAALVTSATVAYSPLPGADHLTIATTSLASGEVHVPYSATLLATKGTAPYAWSILYNAAKLKQLGLMLNAKTGALSGKPKKAGTFWIIVQVKDKKGSHTAASLLVQIT